MVGAMSMRCECVTIAVTRLIKNIAHETKVKFKLHVFRVHFSFCAPLDGSVVFSRLDCDRDRCWILDFYSLIFFFAFATENVI